MKKNANGYGVVEADVMTAAAFGKRSKYMFLYRIPICLNQSRRSR
jgi:hypothetical protein